MAHTILGAFEYPGRNAPRHPGFMCPSLSTFNSLQIGAQDDCTPNFTGRVIHLASFEKLKNVIDEAKNDRDLTLLVGGRYNDSKGYYVYPTVYISINPTHKIIHTEFFGDILAKYVYPDEAFDEFIKLVHCSGGGYTLTGSVFASDWLILPKAEGMLAATFT